MEHDQNNEATLAYIAGQLRGITERVDVLEGITQRLLLAIEQHLGQLIARL